MISVTKTIFCICSILLIYCSSLAARNPEYWAYWDQSDESSFSSIDHSEFDFILRTYVVTNHPSGINRFRYGLVSTGHKNRLESYISSIAQIDPRAHSRAEQRIYWINLYNALIIDLVIDNYPVDSIKDIIGNDGVGPLELKLITVAKKHLSLDDIEHRILRPIWQDHKIHFALVCASLGCPNVQPVAYTRTNIRKLLARAGREFVNHRRGLNFVNGQLQVSRIFEWYEKDFAADRKTLLKVFAHYAEDRTALYLLGFDGEIHYNYDWRINAP